jgi:hypothetical protein
VKLSKIENPFKKFMSACGHDVSHVPNSSMDTLFGMSEFFEWTEDLHNNLPVLHVISLDGFASDVIFNTWQQYNFIHKLIPDHIADNPNAIILFENSAEGHCDKNIFEFIHQITTHYALSNVFYGNSCVNISDIFKTFAYDTYDVLCTRNYKEDAMLQLKVDNQFDFDTPKTHLFSCLNNAPRPHRILLLGALLNRNMDSILSTPNVDFDEVVTNTMKYVSDNYTSLEKIKIAIEYLEKLKEHYPISYDDRNEDVVHMKTFGDTKGILDCDFQLITESSAGQELYFTEKVFKPIILKQPFIILGPARIYEHLRTMGYKTYEHLFPNQSFYDTTIDIFDKIDMLIDVLEFLYIKKDNNEIWEQVVLQNKQCAEHNYKIFQHNSQEIVEKIKIDLNNWLTVYTDFNKIFKNA